jgi:hypothetical protein
VRYEAEDIDYGKKVEWNGNQDAHPFFYFQGENL